VDSTVSVRELNQQTSAVLGRVSGGEELVVTSSGVPLARIVPFKPRSTYEQMVAEGRIHPAKNSSPIDFSACPVLPASFDLDAFLEEERSERGFA